MHVPEAFGLRKGWHLRPLRPHSEADTAPGATPITLLAPSPPAPAAPVLPRARGHVRLVAQAREDSTALSEFRPSGSLRCLFPRRKDGRLDAVLLNTAGGLTGGDRFGVEASVRPAGHLCVTTQAAERVYAALPGDPARMESRLHVAEGARLDWLPQETILFEGAALDRRLTVTLAPGARLLLVEPLIFGRLARGEVLTRATLRDRVAVDRGGLPLWRDGIDLGPAISALMDRAAIGGGARAMASLLFVAAEAEGHLEPLRAMLPDTGGVSLVGADVLALRLLAADGFDLRRMLLPILDRLTGGDLPKCWRL